jgi:hypothetical protein
MSRIMIGRAQGRCVLQFTRLTVLTVLTVLLYWGGASMVKEYELTLSKSTLEQSIGPGIASSLKKFVQIEITKVSNPQLIPLSFAVNFQSAQGRRTYLGSFSLFPPDNPGKFIVASRGILETGGTVSVTLVPLQPVTENPKVRVWVKPLDFVGELGK